MQDDGERVHLKRVCNAYRSLAAQAKAQSVDQGALASACRLAAGLRQQTLE